MTTEKETKLAIHRQNKNRLFDVDDLALDIPGWPSVEDAHDDIDEMLSVGILDSFEYNGSPIYLPLELDNVQRMSTICPAKQGEC